MARIIKCEDCGEEKEYHAKGKCHTCYRRVYGKAYRARPEVKAKLEAYNQVYKKAYYQRPEVIARRKAYKQTPECKARDKAYYQKNKKRITLQMRAYGKAYRQRPEVDAHIRERRARPGAKDTVKAYDKVYNARPEIKARALSRSRTPKARADRKVYLAHPEVKARIAKYIRNRKRTNEQYAILCRLKNSLWVALDKYTKTGKVMTSKQYGIDHKACIEHLGKCPGRRKDYDIDHIQPLSSFDLTKPAEVKRAFAPENLRWLSARVNRSISNKRHDVQTELIHYGR